MKVNKLLCAFAMLCCAHTVLGEEKQQAKCTKFTSTLLALDQTRRMIELSVGDPARTQLSDDILEWIYDDCEGDTFIVSFRHNDFSKIPKKVRNRNAQFLAAIEWMVSGWRWR